MRFLSSILIFISIALAFSCEKPDNEPPKAEFIIQPRFGDSLTIFHFDASLSSDNMTDNFRLKTRWDINNDGNWESGLSIKKSFAFRFSSNGTYSVRCEISDDRGNTSDVVHKVQVQPVPRDSVFTDARDGRQYHAVFLFDRWWMRENLNYGESLVNGELPSDNNSVEKYLFPDQPNDGSYGGFYSWNEATDYGSDLINGICPDGWRLPLLEDIIGIEELLYFTEDYEEYLSFGGLFNLDLVLTGKYIMTAKTWDSQGRTGNFWMNYQQAFPKFVTWASYNRYSFKPGILTDYNPLVAEAVLWDNLWGPFTYHKVALPVRCLKDHEIN